MERYLFVAYFLFLILTLLVRTRIVKGPWLFLFRAFFPNWKFYHAVGYIPHLYVRYQRSDAAWSEWALQYPRRPRNLLRVFHNPDGNAALAEQNLVDHWAYDLEDLPQGQDPRELVTYQLVSRVARRWALAQHPDVSHYQFELRMEKPLITGAFVTQLMLTSPELTP